MDCDYCQGIRPDHVRLDCGLSYPIRPGSIRARSARGRPQGVLKSPTDPQEISQGTPGGPELRDPTQHLDQQPLVPVLVAQLARGPMESS